MSDVKPGDIVMWYTRNQKPKYGRVLIASPIWREIDLVLNKMYPGRPVELVEYCSRVGEKTFVVAIYRGTTDMIPYVFPESWLETKKLQVVQSAARIWTAEELGIALNRYMNYPWKFGAKEELERNITKILQNFDAVGAEIRELNEIGNTLAGGAPKGERIIKRTEDFVLTKQEAERVYEFFKREIEAYQNPFMEHWIIFRRYMEERKSIAEISEELKRDPKTVRGYIKDLVDKIADDLNIQEVDPDLIFWFCELLQVKTMKNRKKVS